MSLSFEIECTIQADVTVPCYHTHCTSVLLPTAPSRKKKKRTKGFVVEHEQTN